MSERHVAKLSLPWVGVLTTVRAASQSPPRRLRTITFRQIAGKSRRAADDPRPDLHCNYQFHVAMLIDDPNAYAIVGGGPDGASCIQFDTSIDRNIRR